MECIDLSNTIPSLHDQHIINLKSNLTKEICINLNVALIRPSKP